MSEGYSDLTPCAKFVLNGCLNENGTRNEPHCEPFYKLDQWEKYQGVAAQRQCETSECLCKPPGFNTSFGVAYQTGVQYCGMFLSTAALKNQEYEDMQNVFATYCASEGYPPKDWILRLVGLHPGNSTGTRNNGTHDEEGMNSTVYRPNCSKITQGGPSTTSCRWVLVQESVFRV
jgi:hypothetical protein